MTLPNSLVPFWEIEKESIEDYRWRKGNRGISDGDNAVIEIDDAAKAEGKHRKGRWLLSGVPVYRDGDVFKIWSADAKTKGKKIAGFIQDPHEIKNRNDQWFETVRGGIQVYGGIYQCWLPVDVAVEDIPAAFDVTPKAVKN